MSTSTLSSPNLNCGSFGPVNDDCYAVGYGMRAKQADYFIGSYRGDESDMAECTIKALADMDAILEASSR